MSKIVLVTFGSLGDLHPMLALGFELRARGHEVLINTLEVYREMIDALGFEFHALRPDADPDKDREFGRELMDAKTGSERLLKDFLLPNLRPMYEDLMKAVEGADLFISNEVVFPAKSVFEKTGVKWISTTLSPGSFLSIYDPFVPPTAQWLKHFRFLGAGFHRITNGFARRMVESWLEPYRQFRRELGLDENHNPVFFEKSSDLLNLAMFSKVIGKPQPDWHRPTLQTGFCFYDGEKVFEKMSNGLQEFLDAGDAPIVFTLGSAAVMDARDFFEESAKAARILKRRAVLLYGIFNQPPKILDENIAGFQYAPYSKIFPRAACVVHQGGVGTTAQALRAGVPHLIMPFSHDQPDNAARCERIGVAESISREKYTAEAAAKSLRKILSDSSYKTNAVEVAKTVESEHGTKVACDAILEIIKDKGERIK